MSTSLSVPSGRSVIMAASVGALRAGLVSDASTAMKAMIARVARIVAASAFCLNLRLLFEGWETPSEDAEKMSFSCMTTLREDGRRQRCARCMRNRSF